jgi:hypothetical protein
MSAFRDSLSDDATRARYDVAIGEFAEVLAAARCARDELYAREGAAAVARAAYIPGVPTLMNSPSAGNASCSRPGTADRS